VAGGTAPVKLLELIGGGEVIASKAFDDHLAVFEGEIEVQCSYYYARVTQADGEKAWGSAVFVG
jgi:hypothetical protein